MNCLQSRRLLLAAPREQSEEHRVHISTCERCANLAHRLTDLERDIEAAALVPVPEALTHRILLPRRGAAAWRYATAAVLVLVSAVLGLIAADVVEAPEFAPTVQAVGPLHPAVAAIAEVMDDRSELNAVAPNGDEMQLGLKRLGLSLKAGETIAHYVGKCHIDGSSDCDRIVLSTPNAYANVLLVPDYPLPARVLVEDRRMVALVSPAGKGGFIVVADSPKNAKRVEKLLVRG